MSTNIIMILVAAGCIIVLLAVVLSVHSTWSLWWQTVVNGAPVNPFRVALMRMRKLDPKVILEAKIRAANSDVKIRTYKLESIALAGADVNLIVDAKVKAAQAGVLIDVDFLKTHQLAGGDVQLIVDSMILADQAELDLPIQKLATHNLTNGDVHNVVRALIIAKEAKINLEFDKAAAIDLAGRDILEAVQMRVQPKVIKTERVTALARDGIELTATARVTVQMDLDHLVGGAGEDTVLARVGEAIVAAIGSAETHKEVLKDPQSISKKIWTDDLSKDTAFYILSVDTADVDVGRNIGAQQERERAETDTKIAQAREEAREQEERTRILRHRADVLEKEASVHAAMAEAIKSGKAGLMDFYKLKSMKADIDMRRSFAQQGKKGESDGDEDESES
jgi:uncharacterized protein YqfA (UPF0365 family)